jgi:Tfp pilus assembly protein PilF
VVKVVPVAKAVDSVPSGNELSSLTVPIEAVAERAVRAIAQIAQNSPQSAAELIDAALKKFPTDPDVNALAGELALGRADSILAELYFREAQRLSPQHASAAVGLATIEIQKGRYDAALENLRPAIENGVSLSPQAVCILGQLAQHGVGAQELLAMMVGRTPEVERLFDYQKVGELHYLAKTKTDLQNEDAGPGRFARSTVTGIMERNAQPIDRVAVRVAHSRDR